MRTVPYTTIRDQVLALCNIDSASATAADLAKIAAFVQRRGREAYQFDWWAETMLCEERDTEVDGERVLVSLEQAEEEPIGLVRGCYIDDPLSEPTPRRVRFNLSGDAIYLPGYGYTSVFVCFQKLPPEDFTSNDAEIPAILRDAIAHAAYSDFLRPSAKVGEVPIEQTEGYAFLVSESRKQQAMQQQAGRWMQS